MDYIRISLNFIVKGTLLLSLLLTGSCKNENLKVKKEFYSNGVLKCKFSYNSKNEIVGKYFEYFSNGNIKEISNYRNGRLNGQSINFYETGRIKSKATYKWGKQFDTTFFYFDTGLLEQYSIYDSKGNEKQIKFYYNNGNLKEIRSYIVDLGNVIYNKNFFESGKLNEDKSKFMEFLSVNKSNDSILVKFHGLEYANNDSITFNVIKNFNYEYVDEAPIIRSVKFLKNEKVSFKIKESDYINNKVNIVIVAYKWTSPRDYNIQEYKAQFSRGEKIPKDNINPIYK